MGTGFAGNPWSLRCFLSIERPGSNPVGKHQVEPDRLEGGGRMKRFLLLVALVVLGVILVGVLIPLRSSPGLEAHLTEEEKTFAQYAFHMVEQQLFDNPIEKAFVLRLKIEALEQAPQVPGELCGDLPFVTATAFRAIVRAETLFGLTWARAEVDCKGAFRIPSTRS